MTRRTIAVYGDYTGVIMPSSDPGGGTRERAIRWGLEALAEGEVIVIQVGRHTRERGWWYRRLVLRPDGTRRSHPVASMERRAAAHG